MISSTHLHAMVIHFPIALLLIGFFSDLIGIIFKKIFFKHTAFYLLILGTFGTIISYFSGDFAGEGMESGTLGKAIEMHADAALLTVWLAITTAILYTVVDVFRFTDKWLKLIRFLVFAILIGCVSRTAYLGGQLVYSHGAGVELALPNFNENESNSNPE